MSFSWSSLWCDPGAGTPLSRTDKSSPSCGICCKTIRQVWRVGYGEALAGCFVDGECAGGAAWCLGAARGGADAYDCGEDGGGAEAAGLFQPVLGCETGEAVAGD